MFNIRFSRYPPMRMDNKGKTIDILLDYLGQETSEQIYKED